MEKIATHDSATGEKGFGILSWLVTPFARTQNKKLREQYDAGCRLFDIRVKQVNNHWVCAHGCWNTKRMATDILREINAFNESCGVTLTYEGNGKHNSDLENIVTNYWKPTMTNIIWGPVSVKYGKQANGFKVKYDIVVEADQDFIGYEGAQGFLPLDGRSWHSYMPIPWLWDRMYKRPHKFNEDTYTYVDFL